MYKIIVLQFIPVMYEMCPPGGAVALLGFWEFILLFKLLYTCFVLDTLYVYGV